MRRTVTVMAAVGVLLVAAACSDAGDDVAGPLSSTSTTVPERGTTSTTAPRRSPTTTEQPDLGGDDELADGGSGDECGPAPVWAFAPMPRQERPAPEDCEQPRPEPELGTGVVQITLRWDSSSDLDLHVTEPNGNEIYFGNKGPSDTGGQLDVDSNVGCEQEASVENVFWPDGEMPLGEYEVEIVGFQVDGCGSGDYTLTAMVEDEQVLDETGTVGENETDAYGFEA